MGSTRWVLQSIRRSNAGEFKEKTMASTINSRLVARVRRCLLSAKGIQHTGLLTYTSTTTTWGAGDGRTPTTTAKATHQSIEPVPRPANMIDLCSSYCPFHVDCRHYFGNPAQMVPFWVISFLGRSEQIDVAFPPATRNLIGSLQHQFPEEYSQVFRTGIHSCHSEDSNPLQNCQSVADHGAHELCVNSVRWTFPSFGKEVSYRSQSGCLCLKYTRGC